MKQAMNFRLSPKSVMTLTTLAENLHMTRTEVIEHALMRYYEGKLHQKASPLLSLFGSISDNDAKAMLKSIKEGRVNKSSNTKL